MTNIYAWPPVHTVGRKWTTQAPVARSQFAFSGQRVISSAGPARRVASATVSVLSGDRSGAGYCEALKRLLNGGVHLVRLYSWPINWHFDAETQRNTAPLDWTSGGDPLGWTSGGDDVQWFTGPVVMAAPSVVDGWNVVTLTGLPPNTMVLRPAEFIRVFATGDLVGVSAQVVAPAYSDGSGVAVARLFSAVPAGVASLGDRETAIFEATSLPEAVQPTGQNWTYQWDFLEVFPAEIDDPVEVDPWR
jgi:hypothetical protein